MGTTMTLSYDADVPTFGERLKVLRLEAGLSLAEAGERAGMTRSSWHDLESGHRKNPTLRTAAAVARALNMSMLELLEGVDVELDDD